MRIPDILLQKLNKRQEDNLLRKLNVNNNDLIDFSSNDYLGFSRNEMIFDSAHRYLIDNNFKRNGSTGSRLLSGNNRLYDLTEKYIAEFHQSESALIYNSGYDANLGFFSCIPQKSDLILYDDLSHASIRDGINLSVAKSFKFKHNDLVDLEDKLIKYSNHFTNIYIVTESVFSMDGDSPDLISLVKISNKYNAFLIIDEAHALGVFGNKGEGLVQSLGIQNEVFARIVTFGKALGCHGAAILASNVLIQFLVNFSRSFIYTTSLSPHSVATILTSYKYLSQNSSEILRLRTLIHLYNKIIGDGNNSAIQTISIAGSEKVKSFANYFINLGLEVKPILYPTVPLGKERLRICLHEYNSESDIVKLKNAIDSF